MAKLPMRIHRARLVRRERLTAGLLRLTLGGPGLHGFATTGVGDEYVRLFLPDPDTGELVLPFATESGWDYPAGIRPGPLRTYTVRRFDAEAQHVVVDVVTHDGGIASAWAQRAEPGDEIGLNTPAGLYAAPVGISWRLLIADATGLPALARLLEDGGHGARTRAVIEVPDAGHELRLDAPGAAEITWIHGGNGHGPSRLEEIVRSIEIPSGPGYLWAAGETRVMRGVRRYLRHERGLPGTAYKIVGYWTEHAEEWTARYEGLDADTRAALEAIWDSGRDEEDIQDEVTERLQLLGL